MEMGMGMGERMKSTHMVPMKLLEGCEGCDG